MQHPCPTVRERLDEQARLTLEKQPRVIRTFEEFETLHRLGTEGDLRGMKEFIRLKSLQTVKDQEIYWLHHFKLDRVKRKRGRPFAPWVEDALSMRRYGKSWSWIATLLFGPLERIGSPNPVGQDSATKGPWNIDHFYRKTQKLIQKGLRRTYIVATDAELQTHMEKHRVRLSAEYAGQWDPAEQARLVKRAVWTYIWMPENRGLREDLEAFGDPKLEPLLKHRPR